MLKFKQLLDQIRLEVNVKEIPPYMQKSLQKEYEQIAARVDHLNLDGKIQFIKDLNQRTKDHLKEKYDKLQNKIYSQEFMRTRDKYGFVFGILNIMFTSFLIGYNPMYYLIWYSVKYIPLAVIRWLRYVKKKWVLYTFDFCYYANLVTLFFIYFGNNDPLLFNTVFLFCFGPIIWAIPIFRNSLVLHSLDRITSCVLHLSAPLACYVIRWMDYENRYGQAQVQRMDILATYSTAIPIYLVWAVFYYIMIFIFFRNKLEVYENLYVYTMTNKSVRRFCFLLGERCHRVMYMVFHLSYFLVCSTLAVVQFNYQWVNTLVLLLCTLASIWNGANYYMVWFSKKYEKQLAMLEAHKQEKQE